MRFARTAVIWPTISSRSAQLATAVERLFAECNRSIEEIALKNDGRRWLARDALLGPKEQKVGKTELPAAEATQELPAEAIARVAHV